MGYGLLLLVGGVGLEDAAAYEFGDLGDDGVAESSEPGKVQPGGKPMNHSAHLGLGRPPIA